ncbi:ATP-dependent DNA helicase PcrA [Atopobium sp. HMSC064B08]|nr:ATP-dependent DNA helicase PcrA [Atopobium sp. HMSC064B08]
MQVSALEVTKEQQEIFDYEPYGMVITAPAGCGKTEALAYRAKGLLERYDFSGNGRRLLITSFTNQAKENISERLKKYIGVQTLRAHVTVCNFHGLASRIIKAHGQLIDIGSDWTLANVDWVGRELRAGGYEWRVSNLAKQVLQDAKLMCLTDEDVMKHLEGIDGQAGEIARNIEKKRINEKMISYDDQIRVALWLLNDYRVADLYRNHFFAALVDEFQDLTPQQLRFVKALCGEDITFAGDIAQSIYSFAGADVVYVQNEIAKSSSRPIKLLKSFRSAPTILNTVNSLSPVTGSEHLSAAFPSRWGSGGVAGLASFDNEGSEAAWVAGMSKSILHHCPHQRIGIITRLDNRAITLKRTLMQNKIEYTDWKSGIFRPEVAGVLSDICSDIQSQSFENNREALQYIQQKAATYHVGQTEELEEGCGWLFDQLFQCSLDSSRACEIKERITVRRGNETIATHEGIHCLTGHTGKGQQFDWVFVLGLEDGTIPYFGAKSPESKCEEARVLSVMISRARIGVFGTYTKTDMRGFKKQPSEFIEYLNKVPKFLCGKESIKAWCGKADWPAITLM